MVKHTLKIFRCEHRKIFKVYLAIFQHLYVESLNNLNFVVAVCSKESTILSVSSALTCGGSSSA